VATVADLEHGQKGVIKEFSETVLPIKLLELGSPLNDPIYINVNGSHIAIRRSLAKQIDLDIVEDPTAI